MTAAGIAGASGDRRRAAATPPRQQHASWMYVYEPWLFAQHGIEAREIEPWDEAGETRRRLEVTFPRHIASHSTIQTYYFDETYAQWRMDY